MFHPHLPKPFALGNRYQNGADLGVSGTVARISPCSLIPPKPVVFSLREVQGYVAEGRNTVFREALR